MGLCVPSVSGRLSPLVLGCTRRRCRPCAGRARVRPYRQGANRPRGSPFSEARRDLPIEPICPYARLNEWPPFVAYLGGVPLRLTISRRHDFGSAAAIVAICLVVYGIFAVGFHWLIPPTRIQSHGVAAYDPPPKTVVDYPESPFGPLARSRRGRSIPLAGPAPTIVESPAVAPKKEAKRQARTARQRERVIDRGNPWDFASRQSYSGYRPF